MTRTDWTDQAGEDLLFLDPPEYDAAIVGIGHRYTSTFLIYDLGKIIWILQGWGMTDEEAREYFAFNTLGAWVGDTTPAFLEREQAR